MRIIQTISLPKTLSDSHTTKVTLLKACARSSGEGRSPPTSPFDPGLVATRCKVSSLYERISDRILIPGTLLYLTASRADLHGNRIRRRDRLVRQFRSMAVKSFLPQRSTTSRNRDSLILAKEKSSVSDFNAR